MLSSIATAFMYMAIAVSVSVIAGLLIDEVLRARAEGEPTPSDWFITRDRNGSLIGGEFIEIQEERV